MATSLAAQVQQLGAASLDASFNSRQKYRPSILFDAQTAAEYDLDMIYDIAANGFIQCCDTIPKLEEFEFGLFDEASKRIDRVLLTKMQNKALDERIRGFLRHGSQLLTTSSFEKCIEWLIRRFRIHEMNVDDLMMSSLPFHGASIFLRILQVVKVDMNPRWQFLLPFKKSSAAPDKVVFVKAFLRNRAAHVFLNDYVAECVQDGVVHSALCGFYVSVNTMFISELEGKLNDTSLHFLLPDILKGVKNKSNKDYQICNAMIISSLAVSTTLAPEAASTMVTSVALGLNRENSSAMLKCLICICGSQRVSELKSNAVRSILDVKGITTELGKIASHAYTNYFLQIFLRCAIKEKIGLREIIEIVETLPLAQNVVEVACDSILSFSDQADQDGSSEWLKLMHTLYQRYPKVFDRTLAKTEEYVRRKITTILLSPPSEEFNRPATSITRIVLGLEHADETIKIESIKLLMESLTRGDIDRTQMDGLDEILCRRLVDDNPKVVDTLLEHSEKLESILGAQKLHETLTAILIPSGKTTSRTRALMKFYIQHVFANLEGGSSLDGLRVLLHYIIPSKETYRMSFAIAEGLLQLDSHSALLGNIEHAAKEFIAASDLDRKSSESIFAMIKWTKTATKHLASTFLASNRFDEILDMLFKVLKEEPGHLSVTVYLILNQLVSISSGKHQLFMSHRLLQVLKSKAYFDPQLEVISADSHPTDEVLASIVGKSFSDSTLWAVHSSTLVNTLRYLNSSSSPLHPLSCPQDDLTEKRLQSLVWAFDIISAVRQGKTHDLALQSLFEIHLKGELLPFLAFVWTRPSGCISTLAQYAALSVAVVYIASYARDSKKNMVDFQLLLPSILIALLNEHKQVRKAALDCVHEVNKIYQEGLSRDANADIYHLGQIYGPTKVETLQCLQVEDVSDFTSAILKSRDDILADSMFVQSLLSSVLQTDDEDEGESVLCCVLSHVISTRDVVIQNGLMSLLEKITSSAKVTLLAPLLKQYSTQWANLPWQNLTSEKQKIAHQLIKTYNKRAIKDAIREQPSKKVVEPLLNVLQSTGSKGSTSAKLCEFILKEMSAGSLNAFDKDTQGQISSLLVDLAIEGESVTKANIRHLLAKSDVQTMLSPILLKIRDGLSETSTAHLPAKKAKVDRSQETDDVMFLKLDFILDILQDKEHIAEYGSLVAIVFDILGRFIDSSKSSSVISSDSVKQSLLSTLTAMVSDLRSSDNIKTLRIDTVVQCIRTSSNPQTHNQALILISNLARLLPDQVLHNVMPIFTFMGSSVLRRDDQYSVNVIELTLKNVVPRLVEAHLAETSSDQLPLKLKDVLTVFVDALVHVPKHRRLSYITTLIKTLGEGDFLYAITELVLGKHVEMQFQGKISESKGLYELALEMFNQFSANDQLQTLECLLKSAAAIPMTSDEDTDNASFFSKREHTDGEMQQFKRSCLVFVGRAVEQKAFRKKLRSNNSDTQQRLVTMVRINFEVSAGIQDKELPDSKLKVPVAATLKACTALTNRILDLMSYESYAETFKTLMSKAEASNRVRLLSTLERQIVKLPDHASIEERAAFCSLVPVLVDALKETNVSELSNVLLNSLTTLAESLAHKNPEVFIAAVPVIISEYGVKNTTQSVKIQAYICISIICREIGARMIKFLPELVPGAITDFGVAAERVNDERDSEIESLMIGCMGVFGSLIKSLPSFVGPYIPSMLQQLLSSKVLRLVDSSPVKIVRDTLMKDMCQHLSIKVIFDSLTKTWQTLCQETADSLVDTFVFARRACDVLKVEDASAVYKPIFKFFLDSFNLSGIRPDLEQDVDRVGDALIDAFIAFVMKLNESIFKPMFTRIVDWAKQPAQKTILFKLMKGLLDRLKSLMVDYYSYVLDDALEYLNNVTKEKMDMRLWNAVVESLRGSFENDQEGYWDADRFDKVLNPMIKQIPLSGGILSSDQVDNILVPAFTQLAVTVNNDALWRMLNTQVLLQTRSEEPVVRMTSLKIVSSWYDRLGNDFVALLPETIPFIHELLEDDDQNVEKMTQEVVSKIEHSFGDSIQNYLQ